MYAICMAIVLVQYTNVWPLFKSQLAQLHHVNLPANRREKLEEELVSFFTDIGGSYIYSSWQYPINQNSVACQQVLRDSGKYPYSR